MSYAQFHDGFYRNLKVRRAGSSAAWMWAASIGYANEHLTDGFVPVEVLSELSDVDSKPRLKLAAKLVEVGLWEVVEGGWRIHDFLKWNFSREQVLARREQVLARVNKHRTNAVGHGEGNARVTRYNERDSGRTDGVSNHPPKTTVPKTKREERRPPTPASGVGSSGSADQPTGRPTIEAALEAIATESSGRFVVPRGAAFDPKLLRPLQALIDGFPALDDWRRVGRWLASWQRTDATVSAAWLAKNRDAFAKAEAWENNGDPSKSGVRDAPLFSDDPGAAIRDAAYAEWERKMKAAGKVIER